MSVTAKKLFGAHAGPPKRLCRPARIPVQVSPRHAAGTRGPIVQFVLEIERVRPIQTGTRQYIIVKYLTRLRKGSFKVPLMSRWVEEGSPSFYIHDLSTGSPYLHIAISLHVPPQVSNVNEAE